LEFSGTTLQEVGMALVECKECKGRVYEHADSCPHCGVRAPGISYKEERLVNEIKRVQEDEKRYAEMYTNLGDGFLNSLFNGKAINRYTDLANEAQRHARELEKELAEVQQSKKRFVP
jgi:hypothetical protein